MIKLKMSVRGVLSGNRKCQLLPFLGDQKHYIRQKSRSFAYWGLSFKPGTDDVREAPAFYVIKTLLKQEG